MADFLASLLEVSLALGALALLLLALTPALGRRFAPQWRCWAWLLLALRLAVPLNISLPQAPVALSTPVGTGAVHSAPAPAADRPALGGTSAGLWEGSDPAAQGQAPAQGQTVPAPSAADADVPARAVSPTAVLFWVWAGGALCFLAAQLASYARFRRLLRRWSRPAGVYGDLPVRACRAAASPVLAGFLRPVIYLPEALDGAERDFALLHEYAHFRRRDLWYKLLLVWANALHWFNPLVWLLRRAAERDVELACDALVLRDRDAGFRRQYGRALLSTVSGRQPAGALTTGFSGGMADLRRRFKSLVDTAPRRPGRAALVLVACAALLAGALVACRAPAALLEENCPVYYDGESGIIYDPESGYGVLVPPELRDRVAVRSRSTLNGAGTEIYLLDAKKGVDPATYENDALLAILPGTGVVPGTEAALYAGVFVADGEDVPQAVILDGAAYRPGAVYAVRAGDAALLADTLEEVAAEDLAGRTLLYAAGESGIIYDPESGYGVLVPPELRDRVAVRSRSTLNGAGTEIYLLDAKKGVDPATYENDALLAILPGTGVVPGTEAALYAGVFVADGEDVPQAVILDGAAYRPGAVYAVRAGDAALLADTLEEVAAEDLAGRTLLYAAGDGYYLIHFDGAPEPAQADGAEALSAQPPARFTGPDYDTWNGIRRAKAVGGTLYGTAAALREIDGTLYVAISGTVDERTLTVYEEDESQSKPLLYPLAEAVRLQGKAAAAVDGADLEEFFRAQLLSSWYPTILEAEIDRNQRISALTWVWGYAADSRAEEVREAQIYSVDAQAGTISFTEFVNAPAETLPLAEGAVIRQLDIEGEYGYLSLEDFAHSINIRSSYGPTCRLEIGDGQICSVAQVRMDAAADDPVVDSLWELEGVVDVQELGGGLYVNDVAGFHLTLPDLGGESVVLVTVEGEGQMLGAGVPEGGQTVSPVYTTVCVHREVLEQLTLQDILSARWCIFGVSVSPMGVYLNLGRKYYPAWMESTLSDGVLAAYETLAGNLADMQESMTIDRLPDGTYYAGGQISYGPMTDENPQPGGIEIRLVGVEEATGAVVDLSWRCNLPLSGDVKLISEDGGAYGGTAVEFLEDFNVAARALSQGNQNRTRPFYDILTLRVTVEDGAAVVLERMPAPTAQ